ncbi:MULTISPECIES: polysaccharide deacetylase family protein [unclassified Paenibacillus]|uniref:polysaccharide deacetylase family protein n=1 Tax=unclassified Paenibacillus TaxID=185978 RepID=UPI001AE1E211|nr:MULTISPECIES: polysaccharide deacetylase family protein [unclassified Paenibacillus]MBP1156916.1 peptidoglycan/xylan/chitin deacetylase (PgdA/CDA1 family) [Paenibacillus sp. PvP091]MBP1172345.1 peptidoglycan/xylan/chitin deacetylase (PgdA/CDA1 family) [Paenibacillus sp. PvR098]MBP2438726.1 peptidoglycan/xylan/chitin deacetylase (PgdA/CDA1 family) [Paenibacillus sp. PvP052]
MTKKICAALLFAAVLISAFDTWGPTVTERYSNQVAVLMYHHVHDTDKSSSTVSSTLFRDQLSYLQSKGYRFITLSEFQKFYEGAPVPDKAVLVTFDDGYQSFYNYAYPVLKELDIPAVNFIVTTDLDDPTAPTIPTLSREQIREMLSYRQGMFDFQCHSDNLHYKKDDQAALTGRLGGETEEQYVERVRSDSKACASKLNEIYGGSHAADTYAYPFGIFSKTAQELITEAGFHYAFTIVNEMATRSSHPMEIPRINAGNPKIQPEVLDKQIMLRIERVMHLP